MGMGKNIKLQGTIYTPVKIGVAEPAVPDTKYVAIYSKQQELTTPPKTRHTFQLNPVSKDAKTQAIESPGPMH